MKVSELEGAELDYWVARAQGVPEEQLLFPLARSGERVCSVLPPTNGFPMGPGVYMASKEWAICGPIFEQHVYEVAARCNTVDNWSAQPKTYREEDLYDDCEMFGPTPLVAICRAVVRAKFGDEVDSPQTYQQEK